MNLILLSGGIDSVVLLHKLIKEEQDVSCISFDYGQKHKKELQCAKYWTNKFGLIHHIIDIQGLLGNSALLKDGSSMPVGDEDMTPTVVPGRNLLMISIAASIVLQQGSGCVYVGTNEDDHAVYPDCRPAFINSVSNALMAMSDGNLLLEAPFRWTSKSDVVKMGIELGVDFNNTWSCYQGEEEPCGVCGACQVRQKAMQ